jgi:hypothetical protein
MGQQFPSTSFAREEGGRNGLVRTRSRLRAWWLCTFGGYRVLSVSKQPAPTIYGSIRYIKTWSLALRTAENPR